MGSWRTPVPAGSGTLRRRCPKSSRCRARRGRRGPGRSRPGPGDDVHRLAGLLLMIPICFKIAGERRRRSSTSPPPIATPRCRSSATTATWMAVRSTGAMLGLEFGPGGALLRVDRAGGHARVANPVPPLLRRLPDLARDHKIEQLEVDDLRAMIAKLGAGPRGRALIAGPPVLRARRRTPTSSSSREAINPSTSRCGILPDMDRFAGLVRAAVRLFDYAGAPGRRAVVVMMGSGSGRGERSRRWSRAIRSACVKVRLYRPFDAPAFIAPCRDGPARGPGPDQDRAPCGEPLSQASITALVGPGRRAAMHTGASPGSIAGVRPVLQGVHAAMAARDLRRAGRPEPKRHFTVGIVDDVTHLSLKHDPSFTTERDDVIRARSSTGSAATARWGPTRLRSRSSARTRRCTPRATSSTTRRRPARRRSPTAVQPAADRSRT